MTGKQFTEIVTRRFGEGYPKIVANRLKVDLVTVYRWTTRKKVPGPVEVWAEGVRRDLDRKARRAGAPAAA